MTENKDQYQVDISDQYQALKEIMVQQQQLIKILNDKLSSIIQTSPKIKQLCNQNNIAGDSQQILKNQKLLLEQTHSNNDLT